ncbi:MAG: molybdopterin cofactor-binding domain-containing protein, partial [Chlamydiota bacterium]
MKSEAITPADLEAAQHESIEHMPHGFELDRRQFFKLLGGGVLVCACAGSVAAQESGRGRRSQHELPKEISAWLHVGENGAVTVYTGKAEMGQNIRTSLAQQVAEELRVPVSVIAMVMGDTDLTPWDMGTFGSRTTPTMGPQLRKVAATAREVLVAMAAERWHVQPTTLTVADGSITNPQTKQSLSYGELTRGQQITKLMPEDPSLRPPAEWRVAGTSAPKVDGRAFVTGEHRYASDMIRPGMMYGKVLRPSAFNATLVSVDTAAAEQIPGVKLVRDGSFIGVVAPDQNTAQQATNAMRATWNAPAQPSNKDLFDYLRKNVDTSEEGFRHEVGSVGQKLPASAKTVTETYTV